MKHGVVVRADVDRAETLLVALEVLLQRLEQALGVARNFKPLDEQQKIAILQKTAPIAMAGKFEAYKSSQIYDGTADNPQWLG